ncbi:MAG: DNA recombination protein RmuC [Pseudomonadota bacterium]
MPVEQLLYIVAGLAGLAVLLLIVLLVQLSRLKNANALDTALREGLAAGRQESAEQARLLRDEVAESLKRLSEALTQSADRSAAAQEAQLTRMGGQLEVLRKILESQFQQFRGEAGEAAKAQREEVVQGLTGLGQAQAASLKELSAAQQERLAGVAAQTERLVAGLEQGLRTGREEQAAGLKAVADLVGQRLTEVKAELTGAGQALASGLERMRQENEAKLEQMRQTVDEKLQGTLEKRLGESFGLVSRQLELVHKSVGEMQSLAAGVGDLKRVLTNVKARGVWGEIQLGSLLDEVFIPEQVVKNAEIRPGSGLRVEFALRLPGPESDHDLLLPIDAKFPQEDYERLIDAAEKADPVAEEAAIRALEVRIKGFAKDICEKYVCPPMSTDFAIMYLPTEGLYAEVLRRPGLAETLWRDWRVQVAGPTTLASILNSLKLGFRTLAIQKRSSEVWQVLGAVKTEFGKYGEIMDRVRKKLVEGENLIDKVAVRKRAIERRLKTVQTLPEAEAAGILGLEGGEAADLEAENEAEEDV